MEKLVLHINQIYLDGIKNGSKTHEYRLGTPSRRNVKINDVITLQSDIETLDVKVKGVKLYSNWKAALTPYWEKDFKDIYSSIDEAIHELSKFYSKQDIEKYQIIVYEIEKS